VHKAYYIYALIDPRDNLIHYVGMSNDAVTRFNWHLHGGFGNIRERDWLVNLQREGLSPILQILETIAVSKNVSTVIRDREQYWIQEMLRLGHPLLNVYGVKRPYWYPPKHKVHIEAKHNYPNNSRSNSDRGTSKSLSISDVARELGVMEKTVRRWILNKELIATRDILGRYKMTREALDAFIEKRKERYNKPRKA